MLSSGSKGSSEMATAHEVNPFRMVAEEGVGVPTSSSKL